MNRTGAGRWADARYQGPRNRGGWPARARTIWDAKAHRQADRAWTVLDHAEARIQATCTYRDPAAIFMDLDSAGAWEIINQAKRAVLDTDRAAQVAAKGRV